MEIGKVLHSRLTTVKTTTGLNKLKPTDKTTDTSSRGFECDWLFEQLTDLVNPQFRAWYCKMFYQLGRERVMILASQARADGKHPQRLFSMLLKKACA